MKKVKVNVILLLMALFLGNIATSKVCAATSPITMISEGDANADIVNSSPAVALALADGGTVVYSGMSAYNENAYEYVWNTGAQLYPVSLTGGDQTLGIVEWKVTEGNKHPEAMNVTNAYQGQNASLVYFSQSGQRCSTKVTSLSLDTSQGYPLITLEGIPAADILFPAAVVDNNGYCVAIAMNQSVVWAMDTDEASFYSTGATGGNEKFSSVFIVILVLIVVFVIIKRIRKKGSQRTDRSGTKVFSSASTYPTNEAGEQKDFFHTEAVPGIQPEPMVSKGEFQLRAIGGYMDGRVYPIGNHEILFGRDTSCMVRFPADAKGVSRMHCKLFWKNGTLMLMDLNSSYGTYTARGKLNPMQPIPIKYNDVFYIGEKKNQFKIQ